ncbi:MAG: hypothetical protein IPG58_19900 [Acidobacteria bacterium]|nr:hypothetical protein [Acidobacteriota bacterium]
MQPPLKSRWIEIRIRDCECGYLAGVFTCGIATTGAAYCWGGNRQELGSLKTTTTSVPIIVDGGLTFTALSAGTYHVCGIVTDGSAYCWGDGKSGKLGTGTNKAALTPVPVAGALKFKSISSGWHHTCGVTTSGALYCWGPVPTAVPVQTDEDGFKAFFREFGNAVRKRDRVAVESYMSPAIVFPVDIRSPRMAFDYLEYNNGGGWKGLEEAVASGARPYKDSEPRPIARITVDKNAVFGVVPMDGGDGYGLGRPLLGTSDEFVQP